MGNIVLLDELTINKIAAGEVIERPASVIKEMVENSIDAGATNITVEIKNGGISYIKVTDNGKGIAKDDLEIAFERHATSKIRTADDLDQVTSMGFRGEALASIAAISKVEMVSKTEEQQTGYKITVEGGNILEQEEVGCQTGTSIVVQNLFFNTPVRYKFLKKDYTESGYIEDAITRIALVNPNISIKLINTGKTVIQTNGNGDLKSVIYNIYGKDVANGISEVSYQYEDIKVSGVIGKPEIARSNRANQLFFVNKRYIKDKTLTAATEQAYKGLIPIGKFGFVVLNIEMNPAKVDVNVHPAKLEVRFEEENKIFQSIYHAIKDTLLKSELVVNTSQNPLEVGTNENLQTKQSNGLFGFRKNNEKQIEKYTEEESKIKTNKVKEEEFYKSKPIPGGPFDTSDVLEQLRKMKEKLEKEIEEKKTQGGLSDVSAKYELETKKEITAQENNGSQEQLQMQQEIDKSQEQQENNESQEQTQSSQENNESQEQTQSSQENNEIQEQSQLNQENSENQEMQKEESKELQELEENTKISNQEITAQENSENQEQQQPQNKESQEKEEKSQNLESQEKEKQPQNIENQAKEEQPQNVENQIDEADKIIENIEDPEIKKEFEAIKQKMQDLNENPQVVSNDFNEMYAKLFGTKPVQEETEEERKQREEAQKTNAVDIIKDNVSIFEENSRWQKPTYKFVGIVFNTYIILEIDREMYILDQHAAHERIMYEKVKKNYYSEKNKDSQLLLLPDVITLTHKEMEIAKDNMKMFEQAGFSLEEFGENTIKLMGVPTVCVDLDTKDLFLETLDEINTVARTAKQEKEEKFIATVACKAAVKANMALTVQEVEALMDKLLELPNPFTCPHGRPTVIKMTKYDIERKFARK